MDDAGVPSDVEVLKRQGEAFGFGGPNGNFRVDSNVPGKGWGMNWNALHDSLSYLDTGGIWGTSRIPKFPLCVRSLSSESYKARSPEGYAILVDLLTGMGGLYDLHGLKFRCEFQ